MTQIASVTKKKVLRAGLSTAELMMWQLATLLQACCNLYLFHSVYIHKQIHMAPCPRLTKNSLAAVTTQRNHARLTGLQMKEWINICMFILFLSRDLNCLEILNSPFCFFKANYSSFSNQIPTAFILVPEKLYSLSLSFCFSVFLSLYCQTVWARFPGPSYRADPHPNVQEPENREDGAWFLGHNEWSESRVACWESIYEDRI